MQKCGRRAALGSALLPLFHSPPLSLSLFGFLLPSLSSFPFFCLTFLFNTVFLPLLNFSPPSPFPPLFSVYLVSCSFSHPSFSLKLLYPLWLCPARCCCASVPAGGCGPLYVAAAAQGQLSAGGDEAGQHPKGMSGGNLHLRGGPGSFWEWREDGEGAIPSLHLSTLRNKKKKIEVMKAHTV